MAAADAAKIKAAAQNKTDGHLVWDFRGIGRRGGGGGGGRRCCGFAIHPRGLRVARGLRVFCACAGGEGFEEGADLGKGTGVDGLAVKNWFGEKEEALQISKGMGAGGTYAWV